MDPIIEKLSKAQPLLWINPNLTAAKDALSRLDITRSDTAEAQARLERFAPYIMLKFPQTAASGGLIESPLTETPAMLWRLRHEYGAPIEGTLYVKRDCDLPISGSIKARGGIYEVLKHAETLAINAGLLKESDNYAVLAEERFTKFFSQYSVQVASTGNLGLSIGVMSAALGFRTTVHMSADAREWKKALLRQKGVTVIEYPSDYSAAVKRGRAASAADPMSYFVDDENNKFNFKSISNKTNFYVNEKGKLTLVFDKYEVAPGYMGMGEFSIPTGEIVDMVTNGYLK